MTEVLVGDSCWIEELREDVDLAARCDVPILITGNAGSTADLARQVHVSSGRAAADLFTVNCAAATEADLDAGLLRPGTLVLARVERLTPGLQDRLMQLMDAQQRNAPRLISAAGDALFDLVRARQFREDLFYRLNVVHLRIPCVRTQGEELAAERCADV